MPRMRARLRILDSQGQFSYPPSHEKRLFYQPSILLEAALRDALDIFDFGHQLVEFFDLDHRGGREGDSGQLI